MIAAWWWACADAPAGRVSDRADVLSTEAEASLGAALSEIESRAAAQVGVLTVAAILDAHMLPRFRDAAYAEGLAAGVAAIAAEIAAGPAAP